MKVLVCLMLICVSWVTNQNLNCNCGRTNMKKIFNGKTTYKNDYPWMVHLNNGCGGSIITEYHVLTAAHCTDKKEPEDIQVYVGMGFRNKEKKEKMIKYGVSRIDQHEDFKSGTLKDDISILVTSQRITFNKFIGPVCMPYTPFELEGKLVKVTGLLEIKDDDEVDLKDINNEECKESRSMIHDTTQISAYALGNDSYIGEPGAGLVYKDPHTERFTQVAVVSFLPKACGNDSKLSINTHVFAYMDWIQQAVERSQPGTKLCKKVLGRPEKSEARRRSRIHETLKENREDNDEHFSSSVVLSNTTINVVFRDGTEILNTSDLLRINPNKNNNPEEIDEKPRNNYGKKSNRPGERLERSAPDQNHLPYLPSGPGNERDYSQYYPSQIGISYRDLNTSNPDSTRINNTHFTGNASIGSNGTEASSQAAGNNTRYYPPYPPYYPAYASINDDTFDETDRNISHPQDKCRVYPPPCPGFPGCPPYCPQNPCCCPGYYPPCDCTGYSYTCPTNPCCCKGFYLQGQQKCG
ncbi:unnamed protein product [Nezara viridula]|uniref:Peptidase S1 domain-containing protein n=1 Tax=Nezara viridula TaxID=85310 RepID=A0A9P0MRX8_NEZVI|nr:unnamed protein product [Nezara viridula]